MASLRLFALAYLAGICALAPACGSDSDGDDGAANTDTPASGRRQRSESAPSTPSSENSGSNDAPSNSDAEAIDEADLGAAVGESEDQEGASESEADDAPPAPAQVFAACLSSGGPYEDCDSLYVTVRESTPPRCVQLTIDNCTSYGRNTLSVDTPSRWELVSGSIGTNPDDCELGVFDASKTIVADASGTISWDEAAAEPAELVLELTLEPSQTGGAAPDVEIATQEPLEVAECAE